MFLLWQPHHSSDAVLFSEYSRNMDNNSVPKIPPSELIQEPSGLRGGEWHFKNYNSHETATLLEAIALVVTHKRYTEAEQIFRRYNIKKEENPELAFYEAVAQLNSTNTKEASTTLEYLNNLNQFRYADEAKFHLAFAHLKSGDRHKAKMVLRQLANSKGKLSEKAEQTLKQIRWF
jgi:TolA-binding protein